MSLESVSTTFARPGTTTTPPGLRDSSRLRIVATGDVLHCGEQLRAVAEAYLCAFPDLRIERRSTHECGEGVCIIESTLTATHEGNFMGVPPTHRSVELLTCSIFTLGTDQLVGEEVVYFDAATLLRQLGVLSKSARPSSA